MLMVRYHEILTHSHVALKDAGQEVDADVLDELFAIADTDKVRLYWLKQCRTVRSELMN